MLLVDKTKRFALNWCSLSPLCSIPGSQVRVALPLSPGFNRICAGYVPILLSAIYSFTFTSWHFCGTKRCQILSPKFLCKKKTIQSHHILALNGICEQFAEFILNFLYNKTSLLNSCLFFLFTIYLLFYSRFFFLCL